MNLLNKLIKNIKQRGWQKAVRMVFAFIKTRTWATPKRRQRQLIKALKDHARAYHQIGSLVIPGTGGKLHPKHRIMNYHKYFVDHISSQNAVLDFGCGNGALTLDVAEKAKRVTGIDIDPKHIALAQRANSRSNISYVVGDATKYNFAEKFDVIILSNVLEHVKDRVALLKKLKTLAPKILLRVPMLTRDWLVVFKKEMGLEYRLDPTHETEYTLESLYSELAQSGWQLESYQVNWGELWGIAVKN